MSPEIVVVCLVLGIMPWVGIRLSSKWRSDTIERLLVELVSAHKNSGTIDADLRTVLYLLNDNLALLTQELTRRRCEGCSNGSEDTQRSMST